MFLLYYTHIPLCNDTTPFICFHIFCCLFLKNLLSTEQFHVNIFLFDYLNGLVMTVSLLQEIYFQQANSFWTKIPGMLIYNHLLLMPGSHLAHHSTYTCVSEADSFDLLNSATLIIQ